MDADGPWEVTAVDSHGADRRVSSGLVERARQAAHDVASAERKSRTGGRVN
jgi:hypothetical protein